MRWWLFVNALPAVRAPEGSDIQNALSAARTAALARLKEVVDNSTLSESVRDQAALYRTELLRAENTLDRLHGLLFERVFGPDGWLAKSITAQKLLQKAASGAGRELLERVGDELRGLLDALL